jgi:hypothetical protein
MRMAWYPVPSVTVPSVAVAPCSPSWLTTVAPSTSSREPSSLVSRKMYDPAVAMFTLPITCAWNRSSRPKSAAALQLIAGMSLSTFGVCPALRVQIEVRGVCRSKTRSVTPGSCGGTAACAWVTGSRPAIRTAAAAPRMDLCIERSRGRSVGRQHAVPPPGPPRALAEGRHGSPPAAWMSADDRRCGRHARRLSLACP